MEKSSAEDDCVDSGAETGGSDYSPLSSTSSELSMGELQDPFLVSVHLIADPGQARFLQRAADSVLAWVHPELQLFKVSERPRAKRLKSGGPPAACQPALAVILFLQEAYGGEEQMMMLHQALQRPPWRYHHTEKVSNGRRMLPLAPCSQDFFTLSHGTPLWAVRQVHYGKEIVRFTVYCSHQNYGDMVRLYQLLLRRRVAHQKDDFCFAVVYANHDMEIQLSFKRLPRGQSPATLESAVMEVRVRDIGVLVPLLPLPCSPISDVRWQTEDYDGNKILLQVHGTHFRLLQGLGHISTTCADSASAPPTYVRNPSSHKTRRYQQRAAPRPRGPQTHQTQQTSHTHQTLQTSHSSLPLTCEDLDDQDQDHPDPDSWRSQRRGQRSSSIFSLPNLGSACSSPGPSPGPHPRSHSLHRRSSLVPQFRINVDALIGAEETDVDTGVAVTPGGAVDLTVVSAYIRPGLPQTPRPLSAPPEDLGPPSSPVGAETSYRSATLGRTQTSFSVRNTSSIFPGSRPQTTSANTSAAPSLSDVSINQSDGCSVISAPTEEVERGEEEEDQEFYI